MWITSFSFQILCFQPLFFPAVKVQPCFFWFPWFPYPFAVGRSSLYFSLDKRQASDKVWALLFPVTVDSLSRELQPSSQICREYFFLVRFSNTNFPSFAISVWNGHSEWHSLIFNLGGKVVPIDKTCAKFESSQGIFSGAEANIFSSQSFTVNIWYQLTTHVWITLCITPWSTFSKALCQLKNTSSSKRNGLEWREAFYFLKCQNKGEIWIIKWMKDSKKALHGKILMQLVHISVNWILKGKESMYPRLYYMLMVKKMHHEIHNWKIWGSVTPGKDA